MTAVPGQFEALMLRREGDSFSAAIEQLSPAQLPNEGVLVRVEYSGLNYKDGLAVTNKGKIVRRFPIVPGIDLAGTVVESSDPSLQPGDPVLATGCGIGEEYWGGYAAYARLQPEWIIPMPAGYNARDAMALGTAGFTAMLCVEALEHQGVRPDSGPVLVTGATGGVGTVAVMLLSKLGYSVTAVTGKKDAAPLLQQLGATELISREEYSARWAGVVDTVGGVTLARALAETKLYGCVAACGNAGGIKLETTVFPLILRGVTLAGISSVNQPRSRRLTVWPRLAKLLPSGALDTIVTEIPLAEVPAASERILQGLVRGRTLVRLAH
jgi:acrylyl-CoA reductase (NADPH)